MNTLQIGNAPCSWGTLEFGSTKSERFTYEQMLDELAGTGYTGSELGDWGFMPTDPATLCDEFRMRELVMTGAFVGVDLKDPNAHAQGEATVLATARLILMVADGLPSEFRPFLVLADDNGTDPIRTSNAGRVKSEMGLSEEQWRDFSSGVTRIAGRVRDETGLSTVFHHHCAGYIETPQEIERLMAMTDPDLVGLVFDTGHYSYGAGDCESVIEAMDRLENRIWYVHFKDCHPHVMAQAREQKWGYFEAVAHGVFCELGQGCVDFSAVGAWLGEHDYSGYITVEQDVLPGMGSPKESARRNRDFLRTIGL